MSTRAIDILINRLPKAEQDVLPQMRAWHFFTAKVEQQEVINELYEAMRTAREESTDVGAWQDKAIAVLRKYKLTRTPDQTTQDWEKYQNDVRNIDSLARLRLIWRVNNDAAYGLSNWLDGMDIDSLRAFPCWRFDRVQGAIDPRPLHVANEGAVRLKWDFKFWADEMNAADIGGFEVPWAPFGFNSWMQIRPVHYSQCPKEIQDLVDSMTDDDFRRIAENADALYGTSLADAYATSKGPVSVKKLSPEQQQRIVDEMEKESITVRVDKDGKAHVELEPEKKPTSAPETKPKNEPETDTAPSSRPEVSQDGVAFELDAETKKRLDKVREERVPLSPARAPRPQQAPAQATPREVQQWGEKKMPETTFTLDESKMSPDDVREVVETVVELHEKYPRVRVDSVSSIEMLDDFTGAFVKQLSLIINHNRDSHGYKGFASTADYVTLIESELGRLHNQSDEYKEMIRTLRAIEQGRAFSRNNVGATSQGVAVEDFVAHEFGHLVHNSIFTTMDEEYIMNLIREAFDNARSDGFIFNVSRYASKNEKEFFAELFVMYQRGEKMPDFYRDFIDRILDYVRF